MGTLYRKVSVSDRTPNKNGRYFVWINEPNADNDEDRMFKTIYKDGFGFQSFYEVTHWLEEIPNNSHKIEKLEADKTELLEALVKANRAIMDCDWNEDEGSPHLIPIYEHNQSLIQKHKQ